MAELPRYNKLGIGYSALPQISTAALQEESNNWGNLNRKLDSLLSFVDQTGTRQAKEKALEYAATNPVTEQQIKDAKADLGKSKSFMDALTGHNVYDNTLREAQGVMLSNQLSVDAQKRFNELKLLSDAGKMDYATAQAEVADLIDGYSVTIAAFSPDASIKARASMATAANTQLRNIADNDVKTAQAIMGLQLNEGMDVFQRTAEDIAFAGDSFDPETQQTITAEEQIRAVADPVMRQALATNNPAMIETMRKRMNKAIVNGVVRGVSDSSFASTTTQAYSRLINGKLGKYQGMWDAMTDDERSQVKKGLLATASERKKLMDDVEKVDKENLMNASYDLQEEALSGASLKRRLEIRDELQVINAKMGSKFATDKFLSELGEEDFGKKGSGNAKMRFMLEAAIDDGESVDLKTLAEKGVISYEDASKLQNRKKAQENTSLRRGAKKVEDAIKSMRGKYQSNSTIAPDISRLKNEFYESALDPDSTLSSDEIADNIIARFEKDKKATRYENNYNELLGTLARADFFVEQPDDIEGFIAFIKDNPSMLDDEAYMENFGFTAGQLRRIKNYVKAMGN